MLRRSRKAVRIWVLHKPLGHSDTTVTKLPQILSHHTQNSDSGSVEKSSACLGVVGRDWEDRYLPKQGFCKSVKG